MGRVTAVGSWKRYTPHVVENGIVLYRFYSHWSQLIIMYLWLMWTVQDILCCVVVICVVVLLLLVVVTSFAISGIYQYQKYHVLIVIT